MSFAGASFLCLLAAGRLYAGEPATEPKPEAAPVESFEASQVELFSRLYEVPPKEVVRLRRRSWTWAEIEYALALAALSRWPLRSIARLREQGASWKRLAEMFGVPLDQLGWARLEERALVPPLDLKDALAAPASAQHLLPPCSL